MRELKKGKEGDEGTIRDREKSEEEIELEELWRKI